MMILTRETLWELLYLFNIYYYYTINQAELDWYTSRITASAVLSIEALSYFLVPEWSKPVYYKCDIASCGTLTHRKPHGSTIDGYTE